MKFIVRMTTCALAFAASLYFEPAFATSQVALFAAFMLAQLIGYGEGMWEAASSAKTMAHKTGV